MLAFQPLAIPVDPNLVQPFRLYPDAALPRAAIEPTLPSKRERMQHGGCRVMCEFETEEADLVRVAQEGMEWIEDVLAAIALSAGIPARRSMPIEVFETTAGPGKKRFLSFLSAEPLLSPHVVGRSDIDFLRGAAIHWRELDTGRRLRRAARRYAQALGERDILAAFQLAYQGLEALEKPLALECGLTPGVEVVTGTCSTCSAVFERKKTSLVGVRALVLGELHGGKTQQRAEEWKRMSKLRNDLMHGLEDPELVTVDAEHILSATMHYLHDACAHLAHEHDRESAAYRMLMASPKQLVILGEHTGSPAGLLVPLLTVEDPQWVQHGGSMVPQFAIIRHGGGNDVGGHWYGLSKPLSAATERDLVPTDWEEPGAAVRSEPERQRTPRDHARKQRRAHKAARKKNRRR